MDPKYADMPVAGVDYLTVQDILNYLGKNSVLTAVDIGASGNSFLQELEGYRKIYFDLDPARLSVYPRDDYNIVINVRVTPNNIVDILKQNNVSRDFGFLILTGMISMFLKLCSQNTSLILCVWS